MAVCVCVSVHLKERLDEYIKQWNGLVKVFRNEKREGLIQARSIGAKKAVKGQVLCLSAAVSLALLLLPMIDRFLMWFGSVRDVKLQH